MWLWTREGQVWISWCRSYRPVPCVCRQDLRMLEICNCKTAVGEGSVYAQLIFVTDGLTDIYQVINIIKIYDGGPGSSVGIATELRAGRSGIESRWGRDFPPFQTGPGAHPASCKMDTGSFPGVKCSRGVLLTTQPLLVPRSWKSRAIPLPTLWATPGL